MPSLRFFVVSALLTLPFFAFAQTSTTTTAQPVSPQSTLTQGLDQVTTSRLNLLLPSLVNLTSDTISSYLDVKIIPLNPGPNETVTVSLNSYLSDLNKAVITWSLNGRISTRGVGKTSFSFQNGPSGRTTNLVVMITTNSGETVTKEFSWTPIGITLLWQANTYVPPFYKGKALLSSQSLVRAIAIPDNTTSTNALSAGNLVYVWEKDGSILPDVSGYGKNSFSFLGPNPYDEMNVRVSASSVDNTITSESRVFLPLSNPFILFYEKDPLLGVLYNKPLPIQTSLNKKEFSLSAEPYFFSNEVQGGSNPTAIKYSWSINGGEVLNPGRTITLRNDTGRGGASLLSLSMRGITQNFQTATKNLRVDFMGTNASSRPTF